MDQSSNEPALSKEAETRLKILRELNEAKGGRLRRSELMERLKLSYDAIVRQLDFLSKPEQGLVDIREQAFGSTIYHFVSITSLGIEFMEDPARFADTHGHKFVTEVIGDVITVGDITNASGVAIGGGAQASVTHGAFDTGLQELAGQPAAIPEDGVIKQRRQKLTSSSDWISALTKLADQWSKEAQTSSDRAQNSNDEHGPDYWRGLAQGYEQAVQALRQLLEQQDFET